MAAPIKAPLNAEPADPAERMENDLPPKSYADAIQEEYPINGSNGTKSANGVNGTAGSPDSTNIGVAKHSASVLRIVETGVPDREGTPKERPLIDRQESRQEYSATVRVKTPTFVWFPLTFTRAWTILLGAPLVTNIGRSVPKVAIALKIK